MDNHREIFSNMHKQQRLDYLNSIEELSFSERAKAPNIIVILMDDLGWGDLSCFGSRSIATPNLDRLARNGVIMENCYASSPVCSPSRFGLLTGRYPCRGMIEHVFFPTIEVEEKYITPHGYERAEDEENGHASRRFIKQTKEFYRFQNDNMVVNGILEDEITIAEILQAKGYRTGVFGKWHLGDRSPHLPNDKGFDYFFGAHYSNDMCPYHYWRNRDIAIEAPIDQRRITGYLNNELFRFISQTKDKPFFAYYASPWPHHPLNCGEDFSGSSRGGVYGDCIQEFDHGIGQLLDLLTKENVLDNTLIVFTSDNGPWHQGSPGGHRGRKGNCFDGGQVVPTIFYWKNKIRSKNIKEQAMNIDFLPTFCELLGINLPDDRIIDGKSLLPLLLGAAEQSPHDYLLYINSLVKVSENQGYAVRSRDNFKYYRADYSENSAYRNMLIHPFLFDLNYDQDESYDVKKIHPHKFAEMKKILDDFNISIAQNPRGWV